MESWKRSSSELFVLRMHVKYMHARIFLAFFGTGSFFGFPAEFSNRMFEIIGQKCEKRILREIFQSEFESIQNLIIKLS